MSHPERERTGPVGNGTGSGVQAGTENNRNNTDDFRMVLAAVELTRAGWAVFPCRAHDISSKLRAKAPLTAHGHLDATTDAGQVREMWRRNPDALIGARVPDSILVLDIDPRNGGSREDIETACAAVLPLTLRVWSGRCDGGQHLYCRRPPGQVSGIRLPRGVDLKVDGYMIMPPSRHPATGLPYAWEHHPVLDIPPALRALLRPLPPPARRPFAARGTGHPGARSQGLLRTLAGATEGERNSVLFWVACRAVEHGVLDQLMPEMLSTAGALGLTHWEAARTIASAAARAPSARVR